MDYREPPLELFQDLLTHPKFVFGYAVDEEDNFRHNESNPFHYDLREMEIQNVKWTSKSPITGKRDIDISNNPGRRAFTDDAVLAIGWKMWFGKGIQQSIPKERIKSFSKAEQIIEYNNGVIEVQLFKHPKDALRKNSFRKRQKKFRKYLKLDRLIKESGRDPYIDLKQLRSRNIKYRSNKILKTPFIDNFLRILRVRKRSAEPDLPKGFGYKCCWFAIETTDNAKLIGEILGFKTLKKCNWEVGLQQAFQNSVFITPPIDGWTFAVGTVFGDKEHKTIEKLLKQLSNPSC